MLSCRTFGPAAPRKLPPKEENGVAYLKIPVNAP
jgi:hypothetical protein